MEYPVPWYGWTITGALIAVCGAIFVAYLSYRFQRRLKLLDALADVRRKLDTLLENYTDDSLMKLHTSTDVLDLYDPLIASCGKDLFHFLRDHRDADRLVLKREIELCWDKMVYLSRTIFFN